MSAPFAAYQPQAHGIFTPVAVEPLARHHLASVVALAVQREGGDPAAWTASLEGSLSATDQATFVARIGERVAGYARVGWLAPGTGDPGSAAPAAWYLLGMIVDPRYRRMGVGRELTAARLRWLGERTDRIWYFVSSQNQASIALHEQFGFSQVGTDLRIPGVSFTGTGLLYAAGIPQGWRARAVHGFEDSDGHDQPVPPRSILETVGPVPGVVKFWKSEKGWGAISSEALPTGRDAFAHFSVIEAEGYRELSQGQQVLFSYHAAQQDRFDFVADWVRADT